MPLSPLFFLCSIPPCLRELFLQLLHNILNDWNDGCMALWGFCVSFLGSDLI